MGSGDVAPSKGPVGQPPSARCSGCHTLYPAPGSSLCSYCALRGSDPDALGSVDVEEPPRDLAKEDRNATKVVEFALGLAGLLLIGVAFVAVYGIGPDFTPVSEAADTFYRIFVAGVCVAMVALVRPVKTRMLRWLEKEGPVPVRDVDPPHG